MDMAPEIPVTTKKEPVEDTKHIPNILSTNTIGQTISYEALLRHLEENSSSTSSGLLSYDLDTQQWVHVPKYHMEAQQYADLALAKAMEASESDSQSYIEDPIATNTPRRRKHRSNLKNFIQGRLSKNHQQSLEQAPEQTLQYVPLSERHNFRSRNPGLSRPLPQPARNSSPLAAAAAASALYSDPHQNKENIGRMKGTVQRQRAQQRAQQNICLKKKAAGKVNGQLKETTNRQSTQQDPQKNNCLKKKASSELNKQMKETVKQPDTQQSPQQKTCLEKEGSNEVNGEPKEADKQQNTQQGLQQNTWSRENVYGTANRQMQETDQPQRTQQGPQQPICSVEKASGEANGAAPTQQNIPLEASNQVNGPMKETETVEQQLARIEQQLAQLGPKQDISLVEKASGEVMGAVLHKQSGKIVYLMLALAGYALVLVCQIMGVF